MIDRATSTDVAALVEIERLCFGTEAWSETLVRAELDAPSRTVLAYRDGSAVAGYASVMATADLADLQRIAVRPDRRGRGSGRRLLDEALRVAALGGADRMLLEVAADNETAIALYGSAGFGEISRRVGYYGQGRDALVMARTLERS